MKQHATKCKWHTKILVAGNEKRMHCDCDGYHTWDELYEHRFTLWIAWCKLVSLNFGGVWKSKCHSDGELAFGGTWFVLGFGKKKGKQITYHLPIEKWRECTFAETLEKAPEFDGHSSDDVLERLRKL